ncbi:MAG: TonB-dependent receptor plug domain-containing protein [Flavobacteriaceae bacterium]
MKKIVLFFFLILSCAQLWSQEVYTYNFQSKSRLEILNQIKADSGFQFYYQEKWFPNEKIDLTLKNASLGDVLSHLIANTNLNYAFYGNSVVFTQRTQIINPFAVDPSEIGSNSNSRPIYYSETRVDQGDTLIYVGKQQGVLQSDYLLRGKVINAVDTTGISDLYLINLENQKNSITDAYGNFEMKLPAGRNEILLQALGFRDTYLTVVMLNNGEVELFVKEQSEQIPAVELTMNPDENVKETVTGVTNLSTAELRNIPMVLGERDILKVAVSLPGVNNAGEASMGYNVRGGKTDQNLMLLDQGVLYNPSHFFGMFSALNPFTTGNLNIYKGNIPAQYGGRLSSVFDIQTKSVNKEKVSGEASIGLITSNLALELPIKKDSSALMIGLRGTYADWILKNLNNEDLAQSEASFYDGVLKYEDQFNSKNKITTTLYYSKDKFKLTSDSLFVYSNAMGQVNWTKDWSEKTSSNLLISATQYNFNIDYDSGSNLDFKYAFELGEIQARYRIDMMLGERHKLNYGLSSKWYQINPGSKSPLDSNSVIQPFEVPLQNGLESAIFFEDVYSPNEKLSMSLGIRLSMFNRSDTSSFYWNPEYRTSLRYFLSETLSLKAGASSAVQYLHRITNNTSTAPTDVWVLSSENLLPEQSQQVSLGAFKNSLDNVYEFSVEGYYKWQENLVDYKTGGQLLLNENIETEIIQGPGRSYGLEFMARKSSGRLNGWLSYTYARSLIKLDGEQVINGGEYFATNYDKPHDLNLVTNYKFTKRYSLSMNFVYQTGRPLTYPVGKYGYLGQNFVAYSDRNAYRMPDYIRLDLGVNIEGNHKRNKLAHSFWNISVYNVTGRNNVYNTFFVSEAGEIKGYENSIYSVPVPTISYNVKF